MSQSKSKWWIALVALAGCAVAERVYAQPYVYALARDRYPEITSQRLLAIDAATNTFTTVGGVRLGRTQGIRPEHLAVAPDGARVYAINSLDFTISVVSTQSSAVVDTWSSALVPNPNGVAVSSDSQRVYVTGTEFVNDRFQAALYVVDVASRTQRAKIPLGFEFGYGLALSPDGLTAYVLTGSSANVVAVINTGTNSVATTVLLPGDRAYFFLPTMSPDGRFLYFTRYNASGAPSSVQVLDTTSNTIVATTTVVDGPATVAVSPDGATVYVSSVQSGQVHRLNANTHGSEGAFAVPYPSRPAFLPDSRRAYVAGGFSADSVYVVDTTTHAVVGRIAVPVNQAGANIYGGVGALAAAPLPTVSPGSTPTNLRVAAISGNRVTLTWTAPTSASPTGYVVEGGVRAGEVLGSLPTGSTATTFSFDAPTGAFYVRVHALSASGRSAASNEIRIFVNTSLPQTPSAPTNLLGLADGSNLALSWKTASAGGAATSLVLDVSGALTTSVPVPPGETVSFASVPAGTYTIAVRAVNGTGTSAASSPVTLTFPSVCPGPPQAPTNLEVSRTGSQLSVSWDPPSAGPAASSYILKVTGALSLALPMATRSIAGAVPPGTYHLSVLAVNSCGSGSETATHTVSVP